MHFLRRAAAARSMTWMMAGGLCASLPARAVADLGLYDVVAALNNEDADDITEFELEVEAALSASRLPASNDALVENRADIELAERQVALGKLLNGSVVPRLGVDASLEADLGPSSIDSNVLSDYVAAIQSEDPQNAAAKEFEGNSILGSPLKLVESLEVESEDGDSRLVIKYNLKFDSSIPRSDWSASFAAAVKDMSADQIKTFIDEEVNPRLSLEPHVVGPLEAAPRNNVGNQQKWELPDSVNKNAVAQNARKHASQKLFGRNGALKDSLDAYLHQQGSRQQEFSAIYNLYQQQKRLQGNPAARAERIKELKAQYKVAQILRENPDAVEEAGGICEFLVKKLGWANLPNSTRKNDCEEHAPRATTTADSEGHGDESVREPAATDAPSAEQIQAQMQQQAAKVYQDFMKVLGTCMALAQQATSQGNKEALKPVQQTYQALQDHIMVCPILGYGAGASSSTSGLAGLQSMSADANPFGFGGLNQSPQEMAKRAVTEMGQGGLKGTEDLKKQQECLKPFVPLMRQRLFDLDMASPTGNANQLADFYEKDDPAMAKTIRTQVASLRRTLAFSEAALVAVNDELLHRDLNEGDRTGTLRSTGRPNNSVGSRQNMGSSGGTVRSNSSRRNTNDRQGARRPSSRDRNDRNTRSNSRSRSRERDRRNVDSPNYLRN